MAYGFQSRSDRVFWLVYDLGGGTFDAAIVNIRDGQIKIVNHGGDDKLGGKDIDWNIAEQILAPMLQRQFTLGDFNRNNKRWEGLFAILKYEAEMAKIRLSRDRVSPINIDTTITDDNGRLITLEYDLKRADIESFVEAVVMKSITICKKVLEEKKLSAGNIENVLLVGGPTLTPLLRDILAEKLGISLEFKVDPLTIVARGAAVFAGTQRLKKVPNTGRLVIGQYKVDLEYPPIGSEEDPTIGGKIAAVDNSTVNGFTIELLEGKSGWTTGQIPLTANGIFMIPVKCERGRLNEFTIKLRDGKGNLKETDPYRFTYTIGATISEQLLQVSVGIAQANGAAYILVPKGSTLPVKSRREIFRSTSMVCRGEAGMLLSIPVVQGENISRADRNRKIGELIVHGNNIRRDLPAGSEVEIIIEINESQQVVARAFVPILDEEYEAVSDLVKPISTARNLAIEYEQEKLRLQQLKDKIQSAGLPVGEKYLNDFQIESIMRQIETDLAAAENDADARGKCVNALLELKRALDTIEDEFDKPALINEAEDVLKTTLSLINEHGNAETRQRYNLLESEIRRAINVRDDDLIRQKLSQLYSLRGSILRELPAFWVGYFRHLSDTQPVMTNRIMADRLFSQGHTAIETGNLEGLKSIVRQLIDLLPADQQEIARNYGSTVIKAD
jgi:molecular chaperone DnaK